MLSVYQVGPHAKGVRPPELLPTVSKLFDCPLRAQPSAPPSAAALGPALRSAAPCYGPRLRRAAYAWALPGRRRPPYWGRSPARAPAQRPGLKIVRSRSGLCRGFPPPAGPALGPRLRRAALGRPRPAPFRPPRCGAVPCRRAALAPQSGGPPRGGRPACAACRAPLPAGLRFAPPLAASALLAWRLGLPGGRSWVAFWRLCRLSAPPGSAGRPPCRRQPGPRPPGPPMGCALRACRFGARRRGRAGGPCAARLFIARAPPGGTLRATGALSFARPARGGTRPHGALSPCGDYVVKGGSLCTPETSSTEREPSPSGPCSEHSSGPGSTTRKHRKKF